MAPISRYASPSSFVSETRDNSTVEMLAIRSLPGDVLLLVVALLGAFLTNSTTFEADPAFSPDAQQVLFTSTKDGNAEIYLSNRDGTNIRRLTNNPDWESFAFVDGNFRGLLKPLPKFFPEEERSKQPSAFTILRTLMHELRKGA